MKTIVLAVAAKIFAGRQMLKYLNEIEGYVFVRFAYWVYSIGLTIGSYLAISV
jgi:hypothetical protein